MKTKYKFFLCPQGHPFSTVCAAAVILGFGVPASLAQTGQFLYTGSETNITLNPGSYEITAYGAQGGSVGVGVNGGLGAEMSGRFSFSGLTTLTLLVGAGGGAGFHGGGGGGGGSFVVNGSTPLVIAAGGGGATAYTDANGGNGNISSGGGGGGKGGGIYGGGGGGGYSVNGTNGSAVYGGGGGGMSFLNGGGGGNGGSAAGWGGYGGGGGGNGNGLGGGGGGGGGYSGGDGGPFQSISAGGGSYIDASAVAIITEISGIASPDGSRNGEIVITAVPGPPSLSIIVNSPQGVTVLWPAVGTYTLQTNNSIAPNTWADFGGTVTTVNGTNSATISPSLGNLFFRLESQQ